MKKFGQALINPELAPMALRVSLVVGSILFSINHGTALLKGEMTRDRWISGLLTYIIPYSVNIHGQHISRSQKVNS